MDEKDIRTGDLIRNEMTGDDSFRPSFVLIGCPCDEGVSRNGGRTGAAGAPSGIREYFYRMTPPADRFETFLELAGKGVDLGDIPQAGMEQMQYDLANRLSPWLKKRVPVVILGGGHETSYGHYLGYRMAGLPHHIINMDAHADVRPLKRGVGHSGSPFRQILEEMDGCCLSYNAVGLQPHANAKNHLAYIRKMGGEFYFRDQTERQLVSGYYSYSKERPRVMTTFDFDVLDQSEAPGVSAPCADGLSKTILLEAVEMAGENPAVASMDLVEVNPKYDRDGQTQRLAALALWRFLSGLSRRSQGRATLNPSKI